MTKPDDTEVSSAAAFDQVRSTATAEMLARLQRSPRFDTERYELEGEVARGGMGAILRIHDRQLDRRLAMKVLLDREEPQDAEARQLAHQLLARFLEEAQVTSQLDHPGVVPVHELGLDQHGKVWFTMRLVKGRTAGEVFAESHRGAPDWPQVRALEVILKVCDTMAYAHEKGVLHRDLKPANVMVGRFGEVYVMDWGLAKVQGQPDRRDLRIRAEEPGAVSQVDSARRHDAEHDDASVVSMDGQKLGTPTYMPPEQARSEELDARADVYAIGAMLYELLTGSAPYRLPGIKKPAYRILEDVLAGPPRRIEELQPGVPAELVAIVDKAMARDREQRYRDTVALAADLRAFLAQHAVTAYRTGPLVELQLWVRRNKPLAASLLAAVLILVAAIAGTSWLASENAALAQERGALAESEGKARAEAQRTVRHFNQLAGVVRLGDALEHETGLWPPWPGAVAAMEAWLAHDAGPLLAMRPQITATVQELEASAGARPTATPVGDEERESARFLHDALVDLQGKLSALEQNQKADVEQRLAWARRIAALSRAHPNARVTWAAAREAIARADGVVASTLYAGRSIPLPDAAVIGLVPIGMNPATKLWEFYELRSAWNGNSDPAAIAIPAHGADGSLAVTDATGIVFVLLPGGTVTLGSQGDEPLAPCFDPQRQSDEELHTVTLAPFLLARHELTQGQWRRLWTWDDALREPSQYRARLTVAGSVITSTHPVEQVSWHMADTLLSRYGMVLPTEAQWEYGCRGGTVTALIVPRAEFAAVANLADLTAQDIGVSWNCESWYDGHVVHAPVGSLRANGFGLHDVHGNVWEWCRDCYGTYGSERPGDGLRVDGDGGNRCSRGGSLASPAVDARPATRSSNEPSVRGDDLGVRAARLLE